MRRSESVAAAVAAVVLVVAAVTVATRGPVEKHTSVAAPSAMQTPSITSEAPTQAPVVNGAAPTAAPSGGRATTAPARPGTVTPPKPGRYEYNETDSNGTRTSTLDISSSGDGKQTENEDSGSTIDEVAWGPSSKVESATTFGFPTGSFRCDWAPDFVEYKFPLRVGRSWTVSSSCHPNAQTSISLSGTSRVTAHQTATVTGQAVDTWVLVTDATIKFSGNGSSFSEAIRDEDHFAPAYGITVHEVATTTDTDPSGLQTHDRSVRDIKSLKPIQQA